MRVVTVDGTSLHAEILGEGETLVLIQGLGYATWAWSRQLAPLAARFRVIAFDNRGAGRSDKPDEPYSIELLADDTLAVIDQLGSAPAFVAGASMGGYVALTLAIRHPDAVRALVLLATSGGGEGAVGVPEPTRRAWINASTLEPAAFARATMPLSFAPGWTDAHSDEFERLLASRLEHPTPTFAWRRQYDACAEFLARGIDAGSIPHRALVLHGTEDRVVPYPNAEILAARLPSSEVVRLEGAGHLAQIERAEEVNAAMLDFFTR